MICYECEGTGAVCSDCRAPDGDCGCDDSYTEACYACDGLGEIDDE